MHKLETAGDLVDVGSGLVLAEAHFGLDGVKEVAASCKVLHHHVRRLGLVSGVVGRDDVRVLRQVFAVLELLLEAGAGGGVFADCLDGNFAAGRLVLGYPCSAVRAFAGGLDEGVALIEAGLVTACICHCYIWFCSVRISKTL